MMRLAILAGILGLFASCKATRPAISALVIGASQDTAATRSLASFLALDDKEGPGLVSVATLFGEEATAERFQATLLSEVARVLSGESEQLFVYIEAPGDLRADEAGRLEPVLLLGDQPYPLEDLVVRLGLLIDTPIFLVLDTAFEAQMSLQDASSGTNSPAWLASVAAKAQPGHNLWISGVPGNSSSSKVRFAELIERALTLLLPVQGGPDGVTWLEVMDSVDARVVDDTDGRGRPWSNGSPECFEPLLVLLCEREDRD